MTNIDPPIKVQVIGLPGFPSEVSRNYEVGKPCLITDLKPGDLFFDVSSGLDDICIVGYLSPEVEKALDSSISYGSAHCGYEFEPGDYERLCAVLIPAGDAHHMAFPLREPS
jgi:hypothetical protein